MDQAEFLEHFARGNGLTTAELAQRKLRVYRCFCDGARCVGWHILHDRFIEQALADGHVRLREVRAYRAKLGAAYNTQPWIFSAPAASQAATTPSLL